MKVEFLSNEWFNAVDDLAKKAGDLQVPSVIQGVAVNVKAGDVEFYVQDGLMRRGHVDHADVLVTGSPDNIRKIFVNTDLGESAKAINEGAITVEGNFEKALKAQTIQPSLQMKELSDQIVAITE